MHELFVFVFSAKTFTVATEARELEKVSPPRHVGLLAFATPWNCLQGQRFWMVSGGRRGPWAPFERFESSVVDFMTFC